MPPDHLTSSAGVDRDWITDVGILVVGLAAAVLTFTTLRDLGESVGYREVLFGVLLLAWLLPVTIDAAGVIAARVWLRAIGSAEAVEFARSLTWSCIVLSVLGNAGRHLMVEFAIQAPWYVVVAVTAVPPAMLGAVVHLGNLVRRPAVGPVGQLADRRSDGPTALRDWTPPADTIWVEDELQQALNGAAAVEPDRAPTANPTGRDGHPTAADRQPTAADGEVRPDKLETLAEVIASLPLAAWSGAADHQPTDADRTETSEYDRGLDRHATNGRLVDDLTRWAADRRLAGRPFPSRDDVVKAYGVGGGRAKTLREECGWPGDADEDADRSEDEPTGRAVAVGVADR